MRLEQLKKLIALAKDQSDKPEGKSARQVADKYLKKMGLSDDDLELSEAVILPSQRQLWEEALAEVITTVHSIDLVQRTLTDRHGDVLVIKGSSIDVKLVEYRFTTLRRAVLSLGGPYERSIRMITPAQDVPYIMDIFRSYVVIALSERILAEDIEEEELTQIEQDLLGNVEPEIPEETPGPDKEEFEAGGFYDAFLEQTADQADDQYQVFGKLDPCVAGYRAGMAIEFLDAIPCESDVSVDETMRLVKKPDLLGKNDASSIDPLYGIEKGWD